MSRMKQLREEKKITQEELAFALDISHSVSARSSAIKPL